jgi:hypothetical protein
MNIKRIILEETNDFDWIKKVIPRNPTDVNVGDYFFIIRDYPKQRFTGSKKVRYIVKVIDIYDVDGVEYVYNMPVSLDDFFEDGYESFYDEDTGEYYRYEDEIPSIEEVLMENEDYDMLTMDKVHGMINEGYWIYTDSIDNITEYMTL